MQRASSGRVLLAILAAIVLVGLVAGCKEDHKDQAIEVVASMDMVPDSGDNSVLLLLPTDDSSPDEAVELATTWANEQGWSGEPIDDARLDAWEGVEPAWARTRLTKPKPGGDLGVMWIGSAEEYLAEPSVEATELLRRSKVADARQRDDFIAVWDITLHGDS